MDKISVVVPLYNEEKNVLLFYNSLKAVLNNMKNDHEIIFVDDGSRDRTFFYVNELNKKDKKVKAVQFQKNYGKAAALSAGFEEAKGAIIITMDGDMQDDPVEIPRFVAELEKGYGLVSGWKQKRQDPFGKRFFSKLFNALAAAVTGVKIHDFNCGFKVYKAKAAKTLNIYGELHRYIPALVYWNGYKVGEIAVRHHARKYGKSKYGVSRLFKGFYDLITVKFLTGYKKKPMYLFGTVGILLGLLGIIAAIKVLWDRYANIVSMDRPLLMLSVLLIVLAVQFISLGFIGELISSSSKEEYKIKKKLE
ncbi:MAG: glycosyltransferase family 2 protein [Candidatus Woesearchaeota archaeon]|nr:glycosyltransferase family 2 protein [Candidatus Woesearchaeota archaeon]